MAERARGADSRLRWQPEVGDVVAMHRAHPCGAERFVVTAVSLDVRLSCVGCGARLMMERPRLRSKVRAVVGRVGDLAGGTFDGETAEGGMDRRHP